MASPISDPDLLTDGIEIIVSVVNSTVQLLVAGNLTIDGVTLKCVYSKLKDLWKSNSTYIRYTFPILSITDEQYEMFNGWNWADQTTRNLIKTGGWAVKVSGNLSSEEWANVISLGSIGAVDETYYVQSSSGNSTNFLLTGPVNQAVQIYASGSFDYRNYFRIFNRIYQKTYDFSQLSNIGVSTLTYQTYRFPISNVTDTKITHDDATVSGTAPYNGMSITWYSTPQIRYIGSGFRTFHVIINGNAATAEQIYEYVHYQLRQNTDIDSGADTHIGKTTTDMVRFVGDTLYTNAVLEGGVFIDNYQLADINRIVVTDDVGSGNINPYVSLLNLSFDANLQNDPTSRYWVYFTSTPSGSFGTSSGVIVNDFVGDVPMSGMVNGASSIVRSFLYDTNNQGGRTPGTDANITIVTIGTSGASYTQTEGVITRSINNSILIDSVLERNYV